MSSAAGARTGIGRCPRRTLATLGSECKPQLGRHRTAVDAPRILRSCDVGSDAERRTRLRLRAARPLPTSANASCWERSPRSHGHVAGPPIGSGDDAAVWSPEPGRDLAFSQDALVEGVDFRRSWISPRRLGARALTIALSDLAGMGAEPAWCVATFCAPPAHLQRRPRDPARTVLRRRRSRLCGRRR